MSYSFLVWPVVVLIFAVVFIFTFRTAISGFIDRSTKLGKDGFTANLPAPQGQQGNPENTKATEVALAEFGGTKVLEEVEQAILDDIENRKIQDEQGVIRVLTRSLAESRLSLAFEVVNSRIFRSQVELLKALNARLDEGMFREEIQTIFEKIKEDKKPNLDNTSFDAYLEFLHFHFLIGYEGNRIRLTERGQYYLVWVARYSKEGYYFNA